MEARMEGGVVGSKDGGREGWIISYRVVALHQCLFCDLFKCHW